MRDTINDAINVVLLLLIGVSMSQTTFAQNVETRISLPNPQTEGDVSVEAALERRRSTREFSGSPLSLVDISQMLWAAQGVTHRCGFRTAPSAGGLYPLETYVVAGNVDGLVPGVYRYRPESHELQLTKSGRLRSALAAAALNQDWVRRAPAVLVFAGVYKRTTDKYGSRGRRYVHMEVGHAAQNVHMQAAARGLATVFVGAFEDTEVRAVLDLPRSHWPLGLMPVGRPR
jgi:SagB-type dehydrogenase family enzyme